VHETSRRRLHALDDTLKMQLQHDSDGAFLMLSHVDADEIRAKLVAAGVPFEEDDGSRAGCIGPEVVILRFAGLDPDQEARLSGSTEPGSFFRF